ncbi:MULTISPECIES: DUF6161 domain-containing protein [unclassified Sphingomonas]|uniref:DUF6161 domain-containing protein n=1 Tax=unclassified Sphingomonas TaxID=196159 RepID=UPI0012E2BA4C|nr:MULTISPECIES: DUF6161 domain-containing protein [unclassified Sphingomonas]
MEFSELSQAIIWCQKQRDAWKAEFLGPNLPHQHPISMPFYAWEQLIDALQHSYEAQSDDVVERPGLPELVAANSPVFNALKWVKDKVSLEGWGAAAVAAGVSAGRIDWTSPQQSIPTLMFERALQQQLNGSSTASYDKANEKQRGYEAKLSEASHRLDNLQINLQFVAESIADMEARERSSSASAMSQLATYETNMKNKLSDIDSMVSASASSSLNKVDDVAKEADERIDNWIRTFQEQNQLQAPVALWNDRALQHGAQLRVRRFWMIGIGIGGLVACIAVSVAAFVYSGWLFGDIAAEIPQATPTTIKRLSEVFKYQLLTSSAATLIFLTMYIWSMKLLVRLYSMEHHLAIDAKGRSALTETYLSLTKEGKATDADRAIMLAVLFRPVADGMVKEDSPPAISPAAIIAGLASSPGK